MASVPKQSGVSIQRGELARKISRLKEKLRKPNLPSRMFDHLITRFDQLTAQLNKLTAQQTRRDKRKK
jgi:hypothetical protein